MSEINRSRKNTPQTSCLESHYKQLLARWQTTAAAVTMQDIAEVLGCNRRYARVLLQSMMARQWLSWTGQRGRGSRGRLHCRVRDVSVQDSQKIFPAISGESGPAEESILQHSHNNSRICVSFYRPIDAIVPSDHTGRVERHLLNMVHAGLTRINDEDVPEPDVAMAMVKSADARTWHFPLRPGLVWHSGDAVNSKQLLQSLQLHLDRPTFSHVTSARLENHQGIDSLVMELSRPDAMLAYRLADPVHGLAHPEQGETGLGPFALRIHSDRQLLLETFDLHHGPRPRIGSVEYRIEARLPGSLWTTLAVQQSGETPETNSSRYISEESAGFIFLTFNVRRGSLNAEQQKFIQALTGVALRAMAERDNISCVTALSAPVLPEYADVVPLPPTLVLGYFWVPETGVLMKNLQRQLRYWGCQLELRPIDANLWFLPEKWDVCDIGVSDLRFQTPWWFAPETRFRHSLMLRQFMPEVLLKRGERLLARLGKDETRYARRIQRIMHLLIQSRSVVPLFSLNFEVMASDGIRGIKVSSQGWPDFTRLWIDADAVRSLDH